MADVYSPDDSPVGRRRAVTSQSREGMPRWVKIFLIVAAVIAVAFIAIFGI